MMELSGECHNVEIESLKTKEVEEAEEVDLDPRAELEEGRPNSTN